MTRRKGGGGKRATLAERFWAKVDRSGECWLWTGATDRGAGVVFVSRAKPKVPAHRVSWQMHHGEITDRFVRQSCGNALCVRPDHLYLSGNATPRGSEHYAWKGDAARDETKRARCQRVFGLGPCEGCGKPATDRHHRDGNTGNNVPENIGILCRRCHMLEDGRLERFKAIARANVAKAIKAPTPCANCSRVEKPLRRGLCHACNEYQRRHGVPRPVELETQIQERRAK